MKIAYKTLGCPIPYEKLGRTSPFYCFAYKVKVKAKYVHVVELGIWVETRKQNLPILENHPILRNSIVAML